MSTPSEESVTRIRIEKLETDVRGLKKVIEDLEARLVKMERDQRRVPPFMAPNRNDFGPGDLPPEITHPRGPQI